jgi:hypothetical protein
VRTLQFIFSVSILLLVSLQAWAKNCRDFGIGVNTLTASQKSDIVNLRGDYGDGITDRVMFLHLVGKPQFAEDVEVINLFDEPPEYPERGSVAIGIIPMGKKENICEKYILYNDVFFSLGETSMWAVDALPIDRVRKGDKIFLYWKQQVTILKTDAMRFYTEGDQEILIYWDGMTFSVQADENSDEP